MENYKIGLEIKKTSNLIRREMDQYTGRMQGESLCGNNGWIIGFLARHQDQDIFQKDIEERFSMRRSTVSAMISLMEDKGLILRIPVTCDARLKKIVLTEKAKAIHHKVEAEIVKMEEKISSDLTEQEICEFLRILKKINQNLTKGEKGEGR